ncbi:MAG: DUF4349 domain-containing protein [bacterium]|nr:DUF4349 domain-containing protein [bacterium]
MDIKIPKLPTSPRGIPWLTLAFIALALITFVMSLNPSQYIFRNYGVADSSQSIAPSESRGGTAGYYPYPSPQYGQVPATDTREFLKTDYRATMRTRQVQELTRRVETTVRGFAGRIDQTSSSPKYGSVSFVIPASKFEEFRTELESFVNPKFLSINIQSQNLLPQKQNIEQTQEQFEKNLADLQAARKKLVSAHASAVNSFNAQIAAKETEIATRRANNPYDITIGQLIDEKAVLDAQLANENASYKGQLSATDDNIKYAQANVDGIKTQDQNLLDNVATVDGTVSLQWISLWEIVQLYLPGYWIPAIFVALAIAAHFWRRRQKSALV